MDVIAIILSIVLLIISLVICAVVLMQESKQAGLSGAISGAADSYFGKNKSRTLEGKLERLTKILACGYFVLALVLYFLLA